MIFAYSNSSLYRFISIDLLWRWFFHHCRWSIKSVLVHTFALRCIMQANLVSRDLCKAPAIIWGKWNLAHLSLKRSCKIHFSKAIDELYSLSVGKFNLYYPESLTGIEDTRCRARIQMTMCGLDKKNVCILSPVAIML